MTQYLIALYRPHDYDPSTEDAAMGQAIDDLNDEMVGAGVRVFVGGLQAPGSARALRQQASGEVAVTEGLYLQAGAHIGGFWVLKAASLEEALAWGRKAAAACRASVEVRPFH